MFRMIHWLPFNYARTLNMRLTRILMIKEVIMILHWLCIVMEYEDI